MSNTTTTSCSKVPNLILFRFASPGVPGPRSVEVEERPPKFPYSDEGRTGTSAGSDSRPTDGDQDIHSMGISE